MVLARLGLTQALKRRCGVPFTRLKRAHLPDDRTETDLQPLVDHRSRGQRRRRNEGGAADGLDQTRHHLLGLSG
jgi:hypothetical protein